MAKRPLYRVEWTEEAWAEVQSLQVFERRSVMKAVEDLWHQAENPTRNRKLLLEPLEDLPQATWEVRVRGKHRLLYCVHSIPGPGNQQKTVEILRAIIKEREVTEEALGRKR